MKRLVEIFSSLFTVYLICFERSGAAAAAAAARLEDVPCGPCVSVSLSVRPLWLALDLALEPEGEIIWPVCLQELSGCVRLCVAFVLGWERTHRDRGNVFDIRSAHTVREAGTAGYD